MELFAVCLGRIFHLRRATFSLTVTETWRIEIHSILVFGNYCLGFTIQRKAEEIARVFRAKKARRVLGNGCEYFKHGTEFKSLSSARPTISQTERKAALVGPSRPKGWT